MDDSMMKYLFLKRVTTGIQGTQGTLIYNNIAFTVTMEREWLNNQSGISCIPEGVYICKRVNSPHFGNTFEVTDVEGRSHILFHKGNIDDDSHGCIILGESFGQIGDNSAVLDSKHGYGEFMDLLKDDDSFSLTITNCF